MSISLPKFISKRILRSGNLKEGATGPVIRIATTGIVLGVMAVVLSIMVVTGFRSEITTKVKGFVADFRISAFNNNESFEEAPIALPPDILQSIKGVSEVQHLQSFILKAGILRTENDLQGVVLKGITADFKKDFFQKYITSGNFPTYSDTSASTNILISESLAKKLTLKTGDSFLVFFIQNDRKVRKVKVEGIYKTGLGEEFDDLYVLCDANLLRRINNWEAGKVSGYEVFTKKGINEEVVFGELYNRAGYNYNTQSARQLYPQMFNWLELQNLNVLVIIALITLVAGVTIISTMLVIVLEHTRDIGILKSLGADDQLIGQISGRISLRVLSTGMLLGNILAFTAGWIQLETGIIRLDESSYYISEVPIEFNLQGILLVNGIIFLTGLIILLLPSRIIAGINPVKVLRFD
jgi:lipoprotein-releasing system permease protein